MLSAEATQSKSTCSFYCFLKQATAVDLIWKKVIIDPIGWQALPGPFRLISPFFVVFFRVGMRRLDNRTPVKLIRRWRESKRLNTTEREHWSPAAPKEHFNPNRSIEIHTLTPAPMIVPLASSPLPPPSLWSLDHASVLSSWPCAALSHWMRLSRHHPKHHKQKHSRILLPSVWSSELTLP